jgi:hypothetical protein
MAEWATTRYCKKHTTEPLVRDRFGMNICCQCEKEVALMLNELKDVIQSDDLWMDPLTQL